MFVAVNKSVADETQQSADHIQGHFPPYRRSKAAVPQKNIVTDFRQVKAFLGGEGD